MNGFASISIISSLFVSIAVFFGSLNDPTVDVIDTVQKDSEEVLANRQRISEINELRKKVYSLEESLRNSLPYNVYNCRITAYTCAVDEVGNDPSNNALMKTPKIGDVAVSRDLKWMLGSKVRIEGIGIYEVNDLMARTYSDGTPIENAVDIYMGKGSSSKTKALKFGVKQADVVVITNK